MTKRQLAISMVLMAVAASAAPSQSRPAVGGNTAYLNVEFKIAANAKAPTRQEFEAAMAGLNIPKVVVSEVPRGTQFGLISLHTADLWPLSDQLRADAIGALTDHLNKQAASDQALSPDQRTKRLSETEALVTGLRRKLEVLSSLHGAQTNSAQMLSDRLNRLRLKLQDLQLQRSAKEARGMALKHGVQERQKEARERGDRDPVAEELRRLVDIRQDELKRIQPLVEGGMVSREEVGKSRAALSEAKVRLAERESALASSGEGDLLGRLSDELAMVEVDLLEISMQISIIEAQLDRYDTYKLDAKRLEELAQSDLKPGWVDVEKLAAMHAELERQLVQLNRERFALKVEDVTVTDRGL
jgi:hypothetical protein